MYDDAFYTFQANNTSPKPVVTTRQHARRPSLLDQSTVEQADGDNRIDLPERPAPAPSPSISIPSPVLSRRTKSITDFHKQARLRIKEEDENPDVEKQASKALKTELDSARAYREVSNELADASHDKYQVYLDQLSLTRRHLESLLEDTTTNLKQLSDLTGSFKAVEAQTTHFQERSRGLLEDQQRVSVIAQDLGENLQYYNLLEPLTRRLNAPGAGNLVRGYDFPQTLANLDRCLEFMRNHSTHKEAQQYESKYRLLMTRALTLIRVHFTNTLREISSEVAKKIAEASSETATSGLLYAKFRVGASELKDLGLEIQKRAIPAPDAEPGSQAEYQSLVNELHQSYSAARGRLLTPMIHKKLAELNATPNNAKDLIAFARSTIGYVRGLCLDEYDLWHEWFDGDGGLYEFLEAVCEPLYDYLRPRTIKETQLQKLCEMCSLIQDRYMDEQDEDSDAEDETSRMQFSPLIRPALEDAQTRLVFLALAVLRDEIERFRPNPIDLETAGRRGRNTITGVTGNAPILSGRKVSTAEPQTPTPRTPIGHGDEEVDPMDMGWTYEGGAPMSEWFPTLRKAIWLLSRIYRLVNSVVFDDLAHQILHQTTLSLLRASTALLNHTPSPASNLPRPTTSDAHLFLLKQLLILKQQIVAFDIEFVSQSSDLDFTPLTSTFTDLRNTGIRSRLWANLASPARLLGGLQSLVPRVVENMLDAKLSLDVHLRSVIAEFTTSWTARMTHPLGLPSSSSGVLTSSHGGTPQRSLQLQQQKGKLPGPAAVAGARTAIEKEVPELRRKLEEWLEDVRVKETLVGAVEEAVLGEYGEFYQRWLVEEGGGATVGKGKKGKGRETDMWDPETFADWTVGVFGVGRVQHGSRDEEYRGGSVSGSFRGSVGGRSLVMSP